MGRGVQRGEEAVLRWLASRVRQIEGKQKELENRQDELNRKVNSPFVPTIRLSELLCSTESPFIIEKEEVGEVEKVENIIEKIAEVEPRVGKVANPEMPEADMAALQENSEMERSQFEAEQIEERKQADPPKNMAVEEKQKLLDEQLEALEASMQVGSRGMEKARQQEHELRGAELEREGKEREEQRRQEELKEEEQKKLNWDEQHRSADVRVQRMTAKLEKLGHLHVSPSATTSSAPRWTIEPRITNRDAANKPMKPDVVQRIQKKMLMLSTAHVDLRNWEQLTPGELRAREEQLCSMRYILGKILGEGGDLTHMDGYEDFVKKVHAYMESELVSAERDDLSVNRQSI